MPIVFISLYLGFFTFCMIHCILSIKSLDKCPRICVVVLVVMCYSYIPVGKTMMKNGISVPCSGVRSKWAPTMTA